MTLSTPSFPRIVKPVEEPLGLYVQPGRLDHKVVSQLLSEDRAGMTGVIFDPTQNDIHEELRIEIGKRNLEAVLDPKMMELASPVGFTGQRTNLPWAGEAMHVPADLRGRKADAVAAEKTGNVGLALLAFGAVGGIDSGVSSGERFDFKRLTRERNPGPRFSPHQRVYIPTLGVFLPRESARKFFAHRTLRALFACANTDCCQRGAESMIADPRRHFVLTRVGEVSSLSKLPPTLRATEYLERALRPATDKLGRAMQYDFDESLKGTLERTRRKLDGWRDTLGEMSRTQPAITLSKIPVRRIIRHKSA